MDIWSEIRREVLTGALSKRAAIAKYGTGWHTLKKMLAHDALPGYRQANQRPKPKLEPFLPMIRQILEDDGKAPTKQKHTAHRIFERLREEHGYTGGETVARIRELRRKPPHGRRRSLQQVCDALNAEGRPSRTGKPWTKGVVNRILRRG